MNPMHHRSKQIPHIHSFRTKGTYGPRLLEKLERTVCGTVGWQKPGLPCNGQAAFFYGFPGIFSKAMTSTTSGSLAHAGVIAWPSACGGAGTIIELNYHCSIEHQIRGDFDPNHR